MEAPPSEVALALVLVRQRREVPRCRRREPHRLAGGRLLQLGVAQGGGTRAEASTRVRAARWWAVSEAHRLSSFEGRGGGGIGVVAETVPPKLEDLTGARYRKLGARGEASRCTRALRRLRRLRRGLGGMVVVVELVFWLRLRQRVELVQLKLEAKVGVRRDGGRGAAHTVGELWGTWCDNDSGMGFGQTIVGRVSCVGHTLATRRPCAGHAQALRWT